MPNYDGTGPNGQGTKTGAQQGKCADAKVQDRPFNGKGTGSGRKSIRKGRKCGFFARFRNND